MNPSKTTENELYKLYKGFAIEQMPLLIADGRVPISPSQLFYRRLELINSSKNHEDAVQRHTTGKRKEFEEFIGLWATKQTVDTGFGVAVHPSGNYKLVPSSKFLQELNPSIELPLSAGALMPYGMYESLEGFSYKRSEIQKFGNRDLMDWEARHSPFWKNLIPDDELRELIILNNFSFGWQGSRHYNKNMAVIFPKVHDVPLMCMFGFSGVENKSRAVSNRISKHYTVNLAGVLPGLENGDLSSLEHILRPKKD